MILFSNLQRTYNTQIAIFTSVAALFKLASRIRVGSY